VAGVHCCHLRHDVYKNSFHIQKSCNCDISTCILPAVLNSHHQIITCLLLWEKARENTFTPVMRHCRMPCTIGCRGRASCTGWEYMLLFKGGWRLLTEMETTLKSNCAFSSAVVKFCEILSCPTWKLHEIKNRRQYVATAPCSKSLWEISSNRHHVCIYAKRSFAITRMFFLSLYMFI
jgi:hypothetical protein